MLRHVYIAGAVSKFLFVCINFIKNYVWKEKRKQTIYPQKKKYLCFFFATSCFFFFYSITASLKANIKTKKFKQILFLLMTCFPFFFFINRFSSTHCLRFYFFSSIILVALAIHTKNNRKLPLILLRLLALIELIFFSFFSINFILNNLFSYFNFPHFSAFIRLFCQLMLACLWLPFSVLISI